MVNNIRLYKGARPVEKASRNYPIRIDGEFADWQAVSPHYKDDAGDTYHRNHPGYGRIKSYTNTTGRNDFTDAKVAAGNGTVSFYIKTAASLTSSADSNWMVLYIRTADSTHPAWEGYQFRINQQRTAAGRALVETAIGGSAWKPVGEAALAAKDNELELTINKSLLGLTGKALALDFKWMDNIPAGIDPMHWLDTGDTAPNGRFRYRWARF